MSTLKSKIRGLGPGLILAGAAIGVSHLIQSTRAGADYGFSLLWVLLLACLTKYPFLEIGPRFAAATGKNLIQGYLSIGKWAYWVFVLITLGTMFIVLAAVTMVTAGIAEMIFNTGWSTPSWSAFILLFCILLLYIGKYKALDIAMKIIITVLTICTLAAVLIAAINYVPSEIGLFNPNYWNWASIAFIIAFMGWMPIPLDAAVWHSFWTLEKRKTEANSDTSVSFAKFDFDMGYLAATGIGVLFLALGALIMFGGEGFSNNSVEFSAQLIDIYRNTLGDWSTPLVSIAALITMLSTTLAVTDAYPRVIENLKSAWHENHVAEERKPSRSLNNLSLFMIPLISWFIIYKMLGSFTGMVDFATSMSFLSAPILAWFNMKLVLSRDFPAEFRPGKSYIAFMWACLLFLVVFCLIYIYMLLR
jgi:Mn2+/Fe2+ NRAMP family transporter